MRLYKSLKATFLGHILSSTDSESFSKHTALNALFDSIHSTNSVRRHFLTCISTMHLQAQPKAHTVLLSFPSYLHSKALISSHAQRRRNFKVAFFSQNNFKAKLQGYFLFWMFFVLFFFYMEMIQSLK